MNFFVHETKRQHCNCISIRPFESLFGHALTHEHFPHCICAAQIFETSAENFPNIIILISNSIIHIVHGAGFSVGSTNTQQLHMQMCSLKIHYLYQ